MSRAFLVAAVPSVLLSGVEAARFKSTKSGNQTGIQIVNGEDASPCEYPWQVGFTSSPYGKPWCGGMLISDQWVLTAAHCVTRNGFHVSAGEHDWSSKTGGEQSQPEAGIYSHPGYNSNTMDNDIALVKVAAPFDLNDCVAAIGLPTSDVTGGEECWITGWGTLKSGGRQPKILQEAKVKIISNTDCMGKFEYKQGQILPSMICAQGITSEGEVSDACQGDSGGPLVCGSDGAFTIDGATSWGYGCAGATYPGVWARVFEFVDWIEGTMANPPTTPEPLMCPEDSAYPMPDKDGDCKCSAGSRCSTTGVGNWDCPTSNGPGAWGGAYFTPDCDSCACYKL